MITTGSKFLIGAAVVATLSAIVYGVAQDGVMGTIGLSSAAIALWFVAIVNLFFRDSNVWADEIASVEGAASAVPAPANSIWAMVFAIGAAVVVVGLVTYQVVFVIGAVIILLAGVEWTAEAWAARASAEASYNADARDRIANPLEFPLAAAIGIGVVIYAFSRIMLWLSKTNTVVAFSVLGGIIILLAFFFAYRPNVASRAAAVALGVGALGLVAGGAVAGLSGERDIHPHETAAELNEQGTDICSSPEEFEADVNASQSVAAVAALAATIILDESGTLTYQLQGPNERGVDGVTLPRSNPNNIVFSNQSGTARRLSIDLGTTVSESGEETPNLRCTTLVDDGGKQNQTVTITLPSITAPEGYWFFVPGVESARLPLYVP